MRFFAYLLAASSLLIPAAPLAAQSLADVAKQEKDRRDTVKTKGKEAEKTFTNKDLPKVPPPAQVVSSGDGKDTAPGAADKPADAEATDKAPAGDKKDGDAKEVKDEAYWRARINGARRQLDRDTTFATAMQSRINALNTDFVNRDDPAQRAVIASDRDRAVAELHGLENAISADKAAITEIEEEARKAGVPAGWLR